MIVFKQAFNIKLLPLIVRNWHKQAKKSTFKHSSTLLKEKFIWKMIGMLPTILVACMNNVMFYQKRFAVASFGVG